MPIFKEKFEEIIANRIPEGLKEQVKMIFIELIDKFELVSKKDFEKQEKALEKALAKIEELEVIIKKNKGD
ncbi:MAG: hypothetical protein CBC42_02490 [Betaproteobacteria bacterium TMED82]|nr:MAG: hypothetical protein CBC42_02490 [Betaproteobacteria bacterium TMED82]|tara:strand:- start:74514 stop:74726 length:213 start_codon:yes stop_codon:yes gene_type:complete